MKIVYGLGPNYCLEKYPREGELGFSNKLIILTLLKILKFVILICDDCSNINNNKITQPQEIRKIYRGSGIKSLIFYLKT